MCNSQIFKNFGNRQVRNNKQRTILTIVDPSGGASSSLALTEATVKYGTGNEARSSKLLKDSPSFKEEKRLEAEKNIPPPKEQVSPKEAKKRVEVQEKNDEAIRRVIKLGTTQQSALNQNLLY